MQSLSTKVFLNTSNIDRSSYIWNAIYSIVFATQSALLLMVIKRTNGIEEAGVFSIAYAIASLISFIGDFGVRKYQVSDVTEVNAFEDYFTSRIITCSIMMCSILFISFGGLKTHKYTTQKAVAILLLGLVKTVESFSDVFYGRYQQCGRLDVSAKTNSFRIMLGLFCCAISLVLTHNLILSCLIWVLASIIGFFISIYAVSSNFCSVTVKLVRDKQLKIIRECFPLFIGSFLLIYLGNAPKYAIDAHMSDASQACYNFIYMPVFAIGLLANFIFNPIMVQMSDAWNNKNYSVFSYILKRQQLIICAITAFAIIIALTIGCPVLGWLFDTNLTSYKMELVILMIGGGMLALVNFYTVVITILRKQKMLSAGYVFIAVIALILSNTIVAKYGILGAAMLYTALMTLLAITFAIILIFSRRLET